MKSLNNFLWWWAGITLLVCGASTVRGYDLLKDDGGYIITWKNGAIPLQVKLDTTQTFSDGNTWSSSVVAAIQAWNAQIGTVHFTSSVPGPGTYQNGNGINEIVLDSTMDGDPFDGNTLAVTLSYRVGNARVESDIVFCTAWTWDSYRGNVRYNSGVRSDEIQRVVIHELGHMLGLGHPDQASPVQSVDAIMNSRESNVDALRSDDIAGARSMYGAPGAPSPANDYFTNASTINFSSGSVQITGTNVAATAESGEPALDASNPTRSTVWWRWTAPSGGLLSVTTHNSNFDTLLGVYTGSSVNALTQIALNDDVQSGVIRTSSIMLNVTSGTTYYFAVDGWGGAVGLIKLNLAYTPPVSPPTITAHPSSSSVQEGNGGVFSVSASSQSGGLTYQWQTLRVGSGTWENVVNNSIFSGANSSYLSFNQSGSILAANGQRFRCVVSNSGGSVTSNEASLTVNPAPPYITTYPQSQTIAVGGTATFSVVARGSGTLSYQWSRNGSALSNANQSTLTVPNATEALAGNYSVQVSNAYGSTTASAQLSVVLPPTIQTQPNDVSVAIGESFALAVEFTWTSGVTVQWSRNGVPISGATSSYLSTSSAAIGDAGVYTVRITNVAGEVVSRGATVTILPRRAPQNITISNNSSGSNISLYVSPASTWGTPLGYQWYLNGQVIAGATSANYSVSNAVSAQYGEYFVVVTGPGGTGISNSIQVSRPASSSTTVGRWLDAREVDGVVYLLYADMPRIARYDLTSETWLSEWTLSAAPRAFDFSSDAIYVAYATQITRYSRTFTDPFTLATFSGTLRAFVVAEQYLLAITEPSYSNREYRIYDRFGGMLISSKSVSYGPDRGIVYNAAAKKFFGRDSGLSPSDNYWFELKSDGTLGGFLSSPYHGDFLDGTAFQVSADGALLFENSGVVYSAPDLRFKASLGGAYQDMLMPQAGGYLILRAGGLQQYDGQFREVASASLTASPERIFTRGTQIFAFTPTTLAGANPSVQRVSMSTLQPAPLPPALDPTGRAIWDGEFMVDASGVVYIYSKLDRNVFRWSSLEGRYLATVPTRFSSDMVVYHAQSHSIFYASLGTTIRRLELGSSSFSDTPFYSAPQAIRGLQATGNSILYVDDTGAWSSHATVSMKGELLNWREWNYYSREYVWSEAKQRLYFFRDDTSPNDLLHESIDGRGQIGRAFDSPYHGEVSTRLPIRVAQDGSQVILGSSQVFDGDTLRLQGQVSASVTDAVIFDSKIYVLGATTMGSQVSVFASEGLGLIQTQSFSGTPMRLFQVPGQRVVLITSNAGVLQFRLLEGTSLTEASPASFTGAPRIVTQPLNASAVLGTPVALSAAATGAPTLIYQWSKDNVDVAGATGPVLVINSVTSADLGSYRVTVTNGAGSVLSNAATLSLETLPVITMQPSSITGFYGEAATFTVQIQNAGPVTYQWYQNGSAIYGATNASFRINPISYGDRTTYYVEITGRVGMVRSDTVSLDVVEKPRITYVSESFSIYEGDPMAVQVNVAANPGATLQWYRNGEAVPGATSAYYSVSRATVADAGTYTLVASNVHGTTTSSPIVVKVSVMSGGILLAASDSHSLFTTGDGVVWGQGNRANYELGTTYYPNWLLPQVAFRDAVGIWAGNTVSIYLRKDETAWAQGRGGPGKFGDVNGNTLTFPTQIATAAAALANGSSHLLLLKTDGTVWARGTNDNGQIGDGIAGVRTDWVQIGVDTRAIAAGDHTSFFLRANGQLWGTGALEHTGLQGMSSGRISRTPELIADQVKKIAVGSVTLALIKQNGSLWTMGRNELGQLGDGTVVSRFIPAQVATDVIQVAASSRYMLFVKSDHTLWGMGDVPFLPESGVAPANRSVPYQLASGVAQVAVGNNHALFSKLNGQIYAGGKNDNGQLGDGSTINRTTPVLILARTIFTPDAPGIAANDGATYAETTLIQWRQVVGATGYEIFRSRQNDVSTAQRIGDTDAGTLFYDRIAVEDIGVPFYYWVNAVNSAGASGLSAAFTRTRIAAQVPQILQQPMPRSAGVGGTVSFSVVADASPAPTYQWQRLPVGGSGWETISTSAANYSGSITPTLSIMGGGSQLSNSGDAFRCVVTNMLGSATSNSATLSVFVAAATRVSAGRYHSLRLDGFSNLFVSGTNAMGQLGNGNTSNVSTAQRISLAGKTLVDVSAGGQHSLFLTNSKELYASGFNANGQLGDGMLVARSTPVRIATEVVAIAAGVTHSVYVKTDGTLWTMGGNDSGQLGNGTTTDRNTPAQVATGVIDVSVGVAQTYFVKFDGTLWGAGDMNGSGLPASTPVQIATNVKSVSAGAYHAIFIKQDGTLWGVGLNNHGQLGNGTTADAAAPVQIATGVKSASAGYFYNAYIKNDNTLWLVGRNTFGQLGDGTTTTRHLPFQLTTNVAVVSASEGYTSFTKNDGTLWATGINAQGQFGNGSTATITTPVLISAGSISVPAAPVGFMATTISIDRVRLTWQPAADATHYEVWRNATNDSATATRIVSDLRWAIYEDISEGAGAAFYWIKGVNAAGTSGFSAGVNGSVEASTAPVIMTEPQSQTVEVGTPVTLSVTASGSDPLSYQWTKGADNISGATSTTYKLSSAAVTDAGDYRVIVSNSAGSTTSAVATLTVNKLTQSITFGALADRDYTLIPITLSATASSGLPVVFSVISGPGTINGNELTLTGTGTLTVRAAQSGNATYAAAAVVNRSFVISKAPATITVDGFNVTYDGSPKTVSVATNPAGLVHDISYNGAQAAPTNAGSYSFTATINDPNYSGSVNGTLVIAKAAQTISFTGPANQGFSVTPITLSATASSALPIAFTVVSGPASLAGATLTLSGSGLITLRANQTGDNNREAAAPVEQSFFVSGNYESWRLAHFTTEELLDVDVSGFNADPDSDGLDNLVEYALGSEPRGETTAGLPEVTMSSTDWSYTYARPVERNDVTYTVEVSTNLTNWTTADLTHELVSTHGGTATEIWRARYPLAAAANAYFRLKISTQ
ncbi:immunoglobulin domain-containing protein [Oleiharenicola lentus]|uniref:immunoglobulin domain-containing protein n=1 Tax=Oleiharenicola lentus TaxID=2508720 RepID=UPI003F672AF6